MTLIDFRTAILLKTSQQTSLTKTQESARSYRVIQGQFFSYELCLFLSKIEFTEKKDEDSQIDVEFEIEENSEKGFSLDQNEKKVL